jgi:hypothetical protein
MLVLRVVGLAVALALGVLVVLYVASGEHKYLRIAWLVFRVALFAVLLVLLILFLERVVELG